MNILFYIPDLNRNIGGIYQYAIGVLKSFTKLKHHIFYLYHPNQDELVMNIISRSSNIVLIKKRETKLAATIRYIQTGYNLFAGLKNKKQCFYFDTILDRIIKENKIQIIHSPFQFLPEYKAIIPGISTMHDVQELRFPEFFSPKERALRALNYDRAITRSNKIIVSYKHIKEDIVKYFNKTSSDIKVCQISMQNLWFENIKEIRTPSIELFEQFILYPAATWRHKNHITLLKSLVLLRERGIIVNLICTGHRNNYFSELEKYIVENELLTQVKFLGAVEEGLLLHLYKTCNAVVIPTLYEAGSFPLMESIILNVPVICANTTSLPDTIEQNKFIFDPLDIHDMASKIEQVLYNDEFIKENLDNSIIQRQKLLTINFSDTIDKVYEEFHQS